MPTPTPPRQATALSGAGEPLPPLYAAWVADLLGGPVPRESRATCDACAMCAAAGERPEPRGVYFDPVIKCCTFTPRLPNFLVGRILADGDTAAARGRATVEQRIAARVAVTPLGLGPGPVYTLLYDNSPEAFGRNRALRCPHYIEDGGQCGIWRHRNSTCTTWFCKHVRGKLGRTFWIESLQPLLATIEADLAQWCVMELAPGDEALRDLVGDADWTGRANSITGEALDARVDTARYARTWGAWRGREADFFTECAKRVEALSWSEVLGVCGPQARAYAELTTEAFGRLISDALPRALVAGEMQIVRVDRETTRVKTYSDFDPMDVPNLVMALMASFDGRAVDEVVAEIASETGIQLEPSLVRKMVDFALLVEPPPPT